MGTVVLVYDDGALDIVHGDSFKMDPLDESCAGPGPTLDPQPILGTCKSCIFNCHILHPFFFQILGQASYAAIAHIPTPQHKNTTSQRSIN